MTIEERLEQVAKDNEQLRLQLEALETPQSWKLNGWWVLLPIMGTITGMVFTLF